MFRVPNNNAEYQRNYERYIREGSAPHPSDACVVCYREIKAPKFYIHCTAGGGDQAIETLKCDANCGPGEKECMGFCPVGPECLKRYPGLKQYVFTNEQIADIK